MRERRKDPAGNAAEQEYRNQHDSDDDRGVDDRAADLPRRRPDDLQCREWLGPSRILPKPAPDVLDVDDRIVDDFADRDRETAKGHPVDRRAKRNQDGGGGQDRQRDRREADDREAAVAKKRDEDHDDEHRSDQHRLPNAANRRRDKGGLTKDRRLDAGASRKTVLEILDG